MGADARFYPTLGVRLLQVTIETRLRILDHDGRYAMVVQGGVWKASNGTKRVLMPFGGGIRTCAKDIATLNNYDITPKEDLRFEIPPDKQTAVEQFGKVLLGDGRRVVREAWREFVEEMVDERRFLDASDLKRFGDYRLSIHSVPVFKAPSTRRKHNRQPMLYCIGVVTLVPPRAILDKLITVSKQPTSHLEFLSEAHLRTGGRTAKESTVSPFYSYLV